MGDVKIALQEVKEELESEVHATVPAGSPAHGPEQLMAAGAITAQELGGPSLGGAVGRHLRFGWLIAAWATTLVIGLLIGMAVMRYIKPVSFPDFAIRRAFLRQVGTGTLARRDTREPSLGI